jgi:hypothetical protein
LIGEFANPPQRIRGTKPGIPRPDVETKRSEPSGIKERFAARGQPAFTYFFLPKPYWSTPADVILMPCLNRAPCLIWQIRTVRAACVS